MKNDNNNWFMAGGVLLILVLLFVGYRVIAVSVGPVKVEFLEPNRDNQETDVENQSSSSQQPQPTESLDIPASPDGRENPSGIVPSNVTILSDGYSLNFSNIHPNSTFPRFLQIELVVTNYSSNTKIFRFVRDSISISDDTGITYPYGNPADEVHRSVQVEMLPFEPVIFKSTGGFDWGNTKLLSFEGPISTSANSLYITFDNFGPFSGFSIEIDI